MGTHHRPEEMRVLQHLHELRQEGLRLGGWQVGGGRYYSCVTGCSSCANLCQGHAISFPPLDDLRKFYRKHRIWDKVKEQLIVDGVIPAEES